MVLLRLGLYITLQQGMVKSIGLVVSIRTESTTSFTGILTETIQYNLASWIAIHLDLEHKFMCEMLVVSVLYCNF